MTSASAVSQLGLRDILPDHASERDTRGIDIDKVGIRGLRYPIRVLDKTNSEQHTVGLINLYVGLPRHYKGTHMSRFIEVLNQARGQFTIRQMPTLLAEIQRRLQADDAYVEVSFPYFISKRAPVSGVESLMEYGCTLRGEMTQSGHDFILEVQVPVTTVCPCSKAISERGAHNQRSTITVEVRSHDFIWIEDIVDAVEACASAPLYTLLKREDEKFVTEQAYDNPKFVEDIVRDVVLAVRELPTVNWLRVTADNQESIHNHSAYAELVWSLEDELLKSQGQFDLVVNREPKPENAFGKWLRASRGTRGLSQQEVATALDVSASYLSRVESGDKPLSSDCLERLATVLGMDPVKVHLLAGSVPPSLVEKISGNPESFLRWAALNN